MDKGELSVQFVHDGNSFFSELIFSRLSEVEWVGAELGRCGACNDTRHRHCHNPSPPSQQLKCPANETF